MCPHFLEKETEGLAQGHRVILQSQWELDPDILNQASPPEVEKGSTGLGVWCQEKRWCPRVGGYLGLSWVDAGQKVPDGVGGDAAC